MPIGSTAADPSVANHFTPSKTGVDIVRRFRAKRTGECFSLHGVDFFNPTSRFNPMTGKTNVYDENWMRAAVAKFQEDAAKGYYPPVHLGHIKPNQPDPKLVGLITNMWLGYNKDGLATLFADIGNIPPDTFAEIAANRIPYRSPEVPDPDVPYISSLALLTVPPYFKSAITAVDLDMEATPEEKRQSFSELVNPRRVCFAQDADGKMHIIGRFNAPAESFEEKTKFAVRFQGYNDYTSFASRYNPEEDYEGYEGYDDEDYTDYDPEEAALLRGVQTNETDAMGKLQMLIESTVMPIVERSIASSMAKLMQNQGPSGANPPPVLSEADQSKKVVFSEEDKTVPGWAKTLAKRIEAIERYNSHIGESFSENAYHRARQIFCDQAEQEIFAMHQAGYRPDQLKAAAFYFREWIDNQMATKPWDRIDIGEAFAELMPHLQSAQTFEHPPAANGTPAAMRGPGTFDPAQFCAVYPQHKQLFSERPEDARAAAIKLLRQYEEAPASVKSLYTTPYSYISANLVASQLVGTQPTK